MPKRTDIQSILVIGAGPIVIGQACEFDYSGTQAIKTLKAEGYRVILVNSNPATIMTDPELADATYIEPITPEIVTKIIQIEKPDVILPTMGGQTALNCAKALAEDGTLDAYGIELIGANLEAINKAENRELFNEAMGRIGLEVPGNGIARSLEEAYAIMERTGLPAIIRPSFTLGGSGGGIAYNRDEFEQIVRSGLDASPTHEVLIDESVLGWKEYEMEVVRDHRDNCIIICSIENIDPMGVHTGDSITVAPALTLTDKEYQRMRDASLAVLREIGVDTGGSNVQFAVNPENGRMVVIEMNPRVSRSSALASKATGFPIAKVAAKLAVGYTLDEILNDVTKATPASFEPSIDYIVTKIPRFAFEKFPGTDKTLNTSMKSVGEAMAMGRCFAESLQKALRSLEVGYDGLTPVAIEGFDPETGDLEPLRAALSIPTSDRLLRMAEALRRGLSVDEVVQITKVDPWFVRQLAMLVETEQHVTQHGLPSEPIALLRLKKLGFSDARLAALTGLQESVVRAWRHNLNIHPVFKRVDTCAGEFEALTSYMYSCYEGDGIRPAQCEAQTSSREKIIILGGGPNRIGQGIEFDYCCVHAAYALKAAGYETIMINCNPETVSTDYDTADRLYFEPLTFEDVYEVIRKEQESGFVRGVIVQFGGQTPLKLARALQEADIPIIGTSVDAIDLAENREQFQRLLHSLQLKQPQNFICHNAEEVMHQAEKIGYPIVVRPSFVLGGRAMQIVFNAEQLQGYMQSITALFGDGPILMDGYLAQAIELDVDALCDGQQIYIAGIMEHIEEAGIHSGDSACSLPPYSLSQELMQQIREQTVALAKGLSVKGLMNVQFAIKDGDIYILEVNPRASRTVPFVAKATGLAIAKYAARIMAGEMLSDVLPKEQQVNIEELKHIAVKEAVFPFSRFPGVDVILGPEMKSTGESMGIDTDFARAYGKAQLGAGTHLPLSGTVFISVKDSDKEAACEIAKRLRELNFALVATSGTCSYLQAQGIEVSPVLKVREGRPHIVDKIKDGEIDLVINTTEGNAAISDSMSIRRTALMQKIVYSTTIQGAKAVVLAIKAMKQHEQGLAVKALQAYFH